MIGISYGITWLFWFPLYNWVDPTDHPCCDNQNVEMEQVVYSGRYGLMYNSIQLFLFYL